MSRCESFPNLVAAEFGDLCKKFEITLRTVDGSEVVASGNGFSLLLWNDRDGVSVWYVDSLTTPRLEVVDLGYVLAVKRRWIPVKGAESSSHEEKTRLSLRSYAETLDASGADILSGDKQWLDDASLPRQVLSEKHSSVIRS